MNTLGEHSTKYIENIPYSMNDNVMFLVFYTLLLLTTYTNKICCQDNLKQYCTFTMISHSDKNHKKEHWPLWSFFYLYVDGEEILLPKNKQRKGKEYHQLLLPRGSKNISLYSMFGDTIMLHAAPLLQDTVLELEPLLFQEYLLATSPILHQSLELGEEMKLLFPYQNDNIYFLHCKLSTRDTMQITVNRIKGDKQQALIIPLSEWKNFIEQVKKNPHPRRRSKGIFIVERGKRVKKYFLKGSLLKMFI